MKYTYTSVRDPRWAAADHSAINCIVKFDHLKQEVEFTANPKDDEPHGREIFQKCVAGEYGPVGEFRPDDIRGPEPPSAQEPQWPLSDRWPELSEFIKEANRENSAGTVRGQVLVWSSMIEHLISRLVETFLVDHTIAKDLLRSSLSTFSAQVDAAFSLSLISKSEHRTCSKIREIRNQVAHSWSISLDDEKVRSALTSLYDTDHSNSCEWSEDIEFLIRHIYSASCSMVALRLAARMSAAEDAKRVKLEDSTS